MSCLYCGRKEVSDTLGVCVECIRDGKITLAEELHREIRKHYALPQRPPNKGDIKCNLCSNNCIMDNGHRGYCALRENINGKLVTKVDKNNALAYTYLDPLPTNCCASWFCPESTEHGYNLATFFYGCNFDCLFCQNYSHKEVYNAPLISVDEFGENWGQVFNFKFSSILSTRSFRTGFSAINVSVFFAVIETLA